MSGWPCVLAAALWLGAAGGAAAQKVYRCGPDGRIYQQTPCNEGQGVDAGDTRSAEQRKAAQAVARGEAKAAAKFDRELDPPKPAPVKPVAPAAAASSAKAKPVPPEKPTIYLAPAPAAKP